MINKVLTNEIIYEAYMHSKRDFFINKQEEEAFFSKLQLIADPETLPLLLPLVFSHNKQLVILIASILHKILLQMSAKNISAMDEMLRNGNFFPTVSFNESIINKVKSLQLKEPIANSIFALLSFHNSGYIREIAVNQLSFDYPHITVPVLLIRANDWVTKIKNAAINKLIHFISFDTFFEFLPHIELLKQLEQKQRYDHSEFISLIQNELIQKCYDELLQMILDADIDKSRIALKIAANNHAKLHQLIKVSSLSADLIIRLETLNIAKNQLPTGDLYDLLCFCLKDKSPVIRKKCIYILLDKFPHQMDSILRDILFDKSFALRELAKFYLNKSGIESITIYRNALINQERPLDLTIIGLAETGNKNDFKLIETYLNDTDAKIKAACVYAVFKLKPDNKQHIILSQLPTAEPKMIKTMYAGLVKYFDEYDIDEIAMAFCQNNDPQIEFVCMKLKLNILQDRWDLIEFILDSLLKDVNNQIKLYLHHKILRWIVNTTPNKIFTRPKDAIIDSIVHKVEKLLSSNTDENLYMTLKNNLLMFIAESE